MELYHHVSVAWKTPPAFPTFRFRLLAMHELECCQYRPFLPGIVDLELSISSRTADPDSRTACPFVDQFPPFCWLLPIHHHCGLCSWIYPLDQTLFAHLVQYFYGILGLQFAIQVLVAEQVRLERISKLEEENAMVAAVGEDEGRPCMELGGEGGAIGLCVR